MSIRIVNTHEAKTRLSELIREVEEGGEVILARNGRPVVRLVPWVEPKQPRTPGAWAGRVIYNTGDVVGSDPDVVAMFDDSAEGPLP